MILMIGYILYGILLAIFAVIVMNFIPFQFQFMIILGVWIGGFYLAKFTGITEICEYTDKEQR